MTGGKAIAQARFHMRIAQNFLEEARQDVQMSRWRSCASNAQMATEHALKAILALYMPVPRVHNPVGSLSRLLQQRANELPAPVCNAIHDILALLEPVDLNLIHIQTDYGSPEGMTPWEIFSEENAREILNISESVVMISESIVQGNLSG